MLQWKDCLEGLLALPMSRLCQALACFSLQRSADQIWGLLLWIEAERTRQPQQLRPGTRLRLQRDLLPGSATETLFQPDRPFACEVFELIIETLAQPLMEVSSEFPPHEIVAELLLEWTMGADLGDRAVGHFLVGLPGRLLENLDGWLPDGFVRSKISGSQRVTDGQRAPLLLEIMLYLLHRQYLGLDQLINLYVGRTAGAREEDRLLAQGVLDYWKESSTIRRF